MKSCRTNPKNRSNPLLKGCPFISQLLAHTPYIATKPYHVIEQKPLLATCICHYCTPQPEVNQPARYGILAHPVDESGHDMKIQYPSVHISTHIGMCTRFHINAQIVT